MTVTRLSKDEAAFADHTDRNARSVAVCVLPEHADRSRLAAVVEAFDVVLVVPDPESAQQALHGITEYAIHLGEPVPQADGLRLDAALHEVSWDGHALPLTGREWEILHCLAARPRRVWSHRELYEAVWGGRYLGDPSTVHAAVKRLRRKLRDAAVAANIDAVRGVGFRLAA